MSLLLKVKICACNCNLRTLPEAVVKDEYTENFLLLKEEADEIPEDGAEPIP